jgi:hypothetical protein
MLELSAALTDLQRGGLGQAPHIQIQIDIRSVSLAESMIGRHIPEFPFIIIGRPGQELQPAAQSGSPRLLKVEVEGRIALVQGS